MSLTPYLYVPLITWAIAQAIKFTIEIIKGDADVRYLYASGGMPSAHSAVVTSLAVYAFFNAGPDSPLFGITAVFAAIVMYDSFGVRRSAGEQAKTLNKLISELAREGNLRKPSEYNQLREILGHQPLEVLVGALLGLVVATIFSWQKLGVLMTFLTTIPLKGETFFIAGVGVVIFLLPILVYLFGRKAFKKSRAYKEVFKYFLGGNMIAGLMIVFYAVVAWQQILPYGQRWVVASIGAVWLLLNLIVGWRFINLRKNVRSEATADNTRKEAWLKKAGKKK